MSWSQKTLWDLEAKQISSDPGRKNVGEARSGPNHLGNMGIDRETRLS